MEEFLESYGKLATRNGYVRLFDGRWIPLRYEPKDIRQGIMYFGKWLPAYLQGGEQSLMRRALEIWTENAHIEGIDYKPAFMNHDEFQTHVRPDQAERLGDIQIASLTQAGIDFNLKIKITGAKKIGTDWYETH